MSSITANRPLRRPSRRRSMGHMCPQCRAPWALSAVRGGVGFLVACRHCSYERAVRIGP